MKFHPTSGRAHQLSLAAAILALTVAACGGAASPSPSPTPTTPSTPAPTPTATPVDVAAEFIRMISDPQFSATAEIVGTMTIGTVDVTVSGSLRGSGDNSDQTLTTTFLGTEVTSQTISVGARTWAKQAAGPWLEKQSGVDETSLTEWLSKLQALEDLGLETRAGRSLHHLRPAGGAPIPPEVLGVDPETVSDVNVTIDFYAEDDGTPAILVVAGSWTQAVGATPTEVSFEFEYLMADIGAPQTIVRPSDVWTAFENATLGYSMAHPEGWTVASNAEGDDYLVDGVAYIFAYPNPGGAGMTLDEFEAAVTATYKDDLGVAPTSVTPTQLGRVPAKLLLMQWSGADGTPLALLDVVAVRGDVGWEVFMITADGPGLQADAELFDVFLASFAFLE